jgi:hypothetical protein
MDNFTKMCNCPKIQGGWVPKVGDWTDKGLVFMIIIGSKPIKVALTSENHSKNGLDTAYQKELIYLPGIRQLMGMVGDHDWRLDRYTSIINAALDGYSFVIISGKHNKTYTGKSEQEAIIQAVMSELHGKKWSGKGWV